MHRAPKHYAVRTRKIHMLENAARLLRLSAKKARRHSFQAHYHQLARLHVALVNGADQVEGAGFRGKDNCVPSRASGARNSSHGERAEAARVARGKHAVA